MLSRTAQPMTLSVTDWLYRLSDFWFQRHRHISVPSDDWSEKWGDMAWTKWRQKKRHWERFSGFVTIPDKLRNANQVIEGQWLTVRVSESQNVTWTAFVIFAMFSLYYLIFSLQFSPIFTFTSSFPQSGRREMILKTNQSQKKVKGTKVRRYIYISLSRPNNNDIDNSWLDFKATVHCIAMVAAYRGS